jgi:hypothetical protein
MPSQDPQAQVCAPLSIFREDRDLGRVQRQRAPPRQVAWQALACPLYFFLSKTATRSHVAQNHPSVRNLLTGRNIWLDPSCLAHNTLIADISDETIAPNMSHVWKSFHRMSSACRIKSGKCQQISMKARPRPDKPSPTRVLPLRRWAKSLQLTAIGNAAANLCNNCAFLVAIKRLHQNT